MKKFFIVFLLALAPGLPAGASFAASPAQTATIEALPTCEIPMRLAIRIIKEVRPQLEACLGYSCNLGSLIRAYVHGDLTISRLGPAPGQSGMALYQVVDSEFE